MTAEIAIMNREAIALAADSAVTMSSGETSEKIFTSANKLFALSKYQPVGIMVYGSAIFMRVPWETIVKIYRKKLGKKKFSTLKEHANDFIEFLDNGNPLFPDSVQEGFLRSSIYAYFNFIKDAIIDRIHMEIDEKGEVTDETIERVVSEIIEEHYKKWQKTENVPSIPKSFNREIINVYGGIIDKAIEEVFERLPISKSHSNQLRKIAASLFSKFPEDIGTEAISGVVIAGFGENDTFPSVESFRTEGVVINKLKYEKHGSTQINFETTASIIPFAQSEMVATFMEGVDPFYRSMEESYLSEIFNRYAEIVVNTIKAYSNEERGKFKEKLVMMGKEILEDHKKKLEDYRKERYIHPVTTVVSMLPKNELAAMAESLVNLTSFKRKVTVGAETVSEPIDVAVISKGDGFIWIKRKHYFKAELNPQFLASYYQEW